MTSAISILLQHCVNGNTSCRYSVKALYARFIGHRSYLTDVEEIYVLVILACGVQCGRGFFAVNDPQLRIPSIILMNLIK